MTKTTMTDCGLTEISRETVSITDLGLRYEIDFVRWRNTPKNIANGANEYLDYKEVYKIRQDGSRGVRLKGINKRINEVIAAEKQARS